MAPTKIECALQGRGKLSALSRALAGRSIIRHVIPTLKRGATITEPLRGSTNCQAQQSPPLPLTISAPPRLCVRLQSQLDPYHRAGIIGTHFCHETTACLFPIPLTFRSGRLDGETRR